MPSNPPADLPRTIGFLGAIAVMISIIIGSGIFRTPASIANQLNDPATILSLWGLGGVIALLGSFTYAELITMFPQSGGVYVFIREAFGRCAAFVFGWTYLLITKPLAIAGICLVMSEHLLPLANVPADSLWNVAGVHLPAVQAVTAATILFLTALNILGLRLGAGVAGVMTIIKVAAVAAIIAVGLWSITRAVPAPAAPLVNAKPFVPPRLLMAIGAVMASVMWTYDGWSDVGAIAGEVKNPTRTLPRVFFTGTLLVTALYVAVNAVYIQVVPLAEMRELKTVAPVVMDRLLGGDAALAVTIIIVIATLSATHASIITGARVTYAQARDGLLFGGLAVVNTRFNSPARALVVQGVLACAVLFAGKSFENLTAGFTFTMWVFYGLGAAAIFVLRARRPNADRPFRCWGYPVVPALFVLASLAMAALVLAATVRWQAFLWCGVLAAGVPMYFIWEQVRGTRQPE